LKKMGLTEPSLIDLFGCESEDRQKFGHYLDEYFSHRRGRRNISISLETPKKIFDTFEDVDQGFVA